MKKLIAGLFAALLTTAGLVAVTSTSAQAACTQYVCNATTTDSKPSSKNVQAGKPVKAKIGVDTRGNVRTSGTVTITITGPGGFEKTITKKVSGKDINVALGKFKKAGKYKVAVAYVGDEGFRDSKDSFAFTVKAKKKK
jgi:hypothetical protein